MPVADVAGIERHIAQHSNGVFCHTIMSGHNFCLVISFKKLLVRGECMVQQPIVQFFVFTLCPYCSQFCMVFIIFLFQPATLSLIQRKNGGFVAYLNAVKTLVRQDYPTSAVSVMMITTLVFEQMSLRFEGAMGCHCNRKTERQMTKRKFVCA